MKLYELAKDYEAFIAAVESGEIPEEAIADTLESIESSIEEKADNIACILKNIAAEKDAIKAEEDKLAERRKTKENEFEKLKTYLSDMLLKCDKTKIETPRNKITFRASEVVVVENESAFIERAAREHDEFLTYKDPTINRTEIKKALANGMEVAGAHIERKQNIQIK